MKSFLTAVFSLFMSFSPMEKAQANQGETIIDKASEYLYVRESNGPNRSKEIDSWNKAVGAPLGSPYCSSFIAAIHKEVGAKAPQTAWSPSMVATNRISFDKIQRGDTAGLYFSSKGRVAHVLLIDKKENNFVRTLEANTSPNAGAGSSKDRDGDGVHRRIRSTKLMSDSRNKFSRHWQ